jgi:hypothetical protein
MSALQLTMTKNFQKQKNMSFNTAYIKKPNVINIFNLSQKQKCTNTMSTVQKSNVYKIYITKQNGYTFFFHVHNVNNIVSNNYEKKKKKKKCVKVFFCMYTM